MVGAMPNPRRGDAQQSVFRTGPLWAIEASRLRLKVLLIDDDEGTQETFSLALGREGLEMSAAMCGAHGLELAKHNRFDCIVIDLRLGDMSGLDLLRDLTLDPNHPSSLLISAFLSTNEIVEAMRLGAFDVLEKPLTPDRLMQAIGRAVAGHARSVKRSPEERYRSVAERWAAYVLNAIESEGDLNTIDLWARYTGASYTTLCEICRLNGIRPLDARDFVRVLRALRMASLAHCPPEAFLVVSDRRTLQALSIRAGVDLEVGAVEQSVSEFMTRQQFVPVSTEAFRTIVRYVR